MRLRARAALAWLLAGAALPVLAPAVARADERVTVENAPSAIAEIERDAAGIQQAIARADSGQSSPEQRLANAQMLYEAKDYGRAAVVLSELIEKYQGTPMAIDGSLLRGETYYAAGEYLSARRDFRALLNQASDPRAFMHAGRAVERLVDVAIRVDDLAMLDEVLAKINQSPSLLADPKAAYARGKALYLKKDYTQAQSAFMAVPPGTVTNFQARYFLGLIAMKQARPAPATPATTAAPAAPAAAGQKPSTTPNYKFAIDTFRQLTDQPANSTEERHIVDLAWMAIARLYYEMEQYPQAAEAYGKLDQGSREYDAALYELAWVYVRMGDTVRAASALETLTAGAPDSEFMADGTLLRADLLLRAGQHAEAMRLYQSIKAYFAPLRDKVETFIDANTDVAVYYDKLTQTDLNALDDSSPLPPLAIRWAREEGTGARAFALIDEARHSRELLKRDEEIARRLAVASSAANRVRMFPDLYAGQVKTVQLLNRIAQVRYALAVELDREEPEALGGEIAGLRARRHLIMGRIATLPTTPEQFAARDRAGIQRWNAISQTVTAAKLDIETLQLMVGGLRRTMLDEGENGITRDPVTTQRFNAEIDSNEAALGTYRDHIGVLRTQIDIGRAQAGFGDARYQDDAARRLEFRDVLEREVLLATQGQAGTEAAAYGQRIQGTLSQARALEDRLLASFAELEARVAEKARDVQAKVLAEQAKFPGYAAQLDQVDKDARDLAGGLAQRSIILVRDKLRGIILRADVGVTEDAWEVREQELRRLRELQTKRARQEQLLDDEMREVIEDGSESTAPATPAAGTGGH